MNPHPALAPLALFVLGLAPAAQLDVPEHGGRGGTQASGVEVPRRPQGDLAPGSKNDAPGAQGPDFGDRRPPPEAPPAPAPEPAPAPSAESPPAPAPTGEPLAPARAGALLDELRTIQEPDDPRIAAAQGELFAAGTGGLSTARAALHGETAGLVLVGAEVLLRAGGPSDRALVAERLSRKLPPRAITRLFDLFLRYDPVGASPEFMAELLEHPQAPLRDAAARELAQRAGPSAIPILAARLRSERSDTRIAALDALAAIDDPSAQNLVLDRLDDSVAKVAARAAQIQAGLDAAEPALLAAAFPEVFDRRAGYARLALVEREDRRGSRLVDESRVPGLLSDLAYEDPLRRASAALLLAGIGFRGESSRGYEWLDRAVPHELVRQISGDVFHKDLSSIVGPAERRLRLLTGQTLGSDGEGWRRWWIGAAPTFRAHRAVVDVAPGEEAGLRVRYKGPAPEHRVLRFLGPAAPPDDPSAPILGRTIQLSAEAASDLVQRLAAEGVLSAQRLPNPTVPFTAAARELEVSIGEQSKRFALPSASAREEDLWFDRLVHTLERLEEQNRWQRYPAGAEPRAFFEAESAWWAESRTPEERDRRLKELVLADLAHLLPFERGPGVAELAALAQRGALGPEDHPRLLGLIRDERYYGERIPLLVGLARATARDEATGLIPADLARDLVVLLASAFPSESAPDVVGVLQDTDPELVRMVARDERPVLRALAAAGLARRGTPEDLELLFELFNDPVPDVEAAAILACAEFGRAEAAEELLFRARVGEPRVREAALRAVGILRVEGARDALLTAMADPSQGVQVAAAEGLADLRDPEAGALFASILARGERSPLFVAAQRGLRDLGPAAHEPLLRAATTAGSSAAREAALLLAEDLVPDAVPILIRLLEAAPDDGRVASELAVLSCVDCREREAPAKGWSEWYRTVKKDDPLLWFRAGCERVGLRAPPAEDLSGAGTPAGRTFLIEVLARPENHLVERARRELGRMLGADLGTLPARGPLRETWLAELALRVAPAGGTEER